MARTHPHAEASYSIVELDAGGFGVRVAIPETYPTTVSPFASTDEAEAWIARHKQGVAAGAATGHWFKRTDRRSG